MRNVKISSVQLALLMIGFTFGEAAILNPSTNARQDAWLVNIFALAGGLVLISVYVCISALNPGKTLVEILKDHFGKVVGSIFTILYLWYFIHLLSIVLKTFMYFMESTLYTETPILFTGMTLILVALYTAKKGLEVIARVGELLVPILILTVIVLFVALIKKYDVQNYLPFLEFGMKPVLKSTFNMIAFPFGETIVLLMIFPNLNNKKKLFRTSILSFIIIGATLMMITTRDLMVLGPDMLQRTTYPNFLSAKLIPIIDIEGLIAINLLIGGGIKITLILYSISLGVSQFFKLDDYKPFVMPISIICLSLSMWIFESMIEKRLWETEVYPYYAVPFQIIIPLIILVLSLMKKKKKVE